MPCVHQTLLFPMFGEKGLLEKGLNRDWALIRASMGYFMYTTAKELAIMKIYSFSSKNLQ